MIEQCEKCDLYNSLGCPYNLEIAEMISDCDKYRPNEEAKIADPIKRRLRNLLIDSPSLVVLYDEQWTASADYLIANGVTIKSEITREIFEEIEKAISNLEYRANTPRKTVRVEELKAQVDWVLHEVVPKTIAELKKKYIGEDTNVTTKESEKEK